MVRLSVNYCGKLYLGATFCVCDWQVAHDADRPSDPRVMLLALVGDVNREAIVINAQAKLW
jgi:hypothetical protein